MDVVPEEKCSYTPKRICHQVEDSPKKVPRGGKKRREQRALGNLHVLSV